MSSMLEIQAKVRGKHPLILIRTNNDPNSVARVVGATQEALPGISHEILLWSPGLGVRQVEAQKAGNAWRLRNLEEPQEMGQDPATWLLNQMLSREEEAKQQPRQQNGKGRLRTVVVLQNPAGWLGPTSAGILGTVAEKSRTQGFTTILMGPMGDIPTGLRHIPILTMPLPTARELSTHLEAAIQAASSKYVPAPDGIVDELSGTLLGLTETEAQDVLMESVATSILLGRKDEAFWTEATSAIGISKANLLEAGAGLRLHPALPQGLDALGGLTRLKPYYKKVARRYGARARSVGLTPAGGTLCVGVPGTGKTFCALALAGAVKLMVVEMDMGTTQSKWVGESEDRLETNLARLEAFGSIVLLFDEAGKMFDIEGADDVYVRLFTRIIKFLEEIKVRGLPIHCIFTSNEYNSMRAEFLSRMDRVVWFGFPGAQDREAIAVSVAKQLYRRAVAIRNGNGEALAADPFDFSRVAMARVAQETSGFTGRDLRKLLEIAADEAFDREIVPTTELVLDLLDEVTSTELVSAAKIEKMFGEVLNVSGGEILLASEPSEADKRTWYPMYEDAKKRKR